MNIWRNRWVSRIEISWLNLCVQIESIQHLVLHAQLQIFYRGNINAVNLSIRQATHPKIVVARETCSIWRNTSRPKIATMTAAMLIPPAAACTDWNTSSMQIANNDVNHGSRRSMSLPTTGPIATPAMPARPNNPITRLE